MHRKKYGTKQWALILSAACVLLATVGVLYAFLSANTQALTNQFDPVVVTCSVEQQLDGKVQRDICVRNTGDIDAFIRAAIVINWVGADGKILATAPVAGTDYAIEWSEAGWMQGSDGFWYHSTAVAPGDATATLIRQIVPTNAPEGFSLQVRVVATAIQAAPAAAAENAWGVHVDGNKLVG